MYNNIDIDAYQESFAGQDDHLLIDVREIDEYAAGRLPGAINIPLSEFEVRINEVPADRAIVLVCAGGMRSAAVAEFMASQGYGQLYNLIDGTMGWMMRGLPLENDQ